MKQSKAIAAGFDEERPNSPGVDQNEYFATLASAAPTPGGGSAAALVVALGASLVAMVARITQSGATYAAHSSLANELIVRSDELRVDALTARIADEAAYRYVVAAMALPKTTADERAVRSGALQTALGGAAATPLSTARCARDVAALARRALAFENDALASDLGCAAEFASAGLAAAALNVRVNHRYMKDSAAIAAQSAELERYEGEAGPLVTQVRCEVARTLAR
ncbi:MAG: cyclodeaminase/cyclohydrolase family protein [Candidatus Eremiobacteraeota bacterium]|nr:cyclodeaminase/cyclohydrolase family protein [Candidatus Eremiobacteraeota bacterium]